MQFVLGVLIAIALVATLVSLELGSIFGDDPMFGALGQTLAIVGAATFAWWEDRLRAKLEARARFLPGTLFIEGVSLHQFFHLLHARFRCRWRAKCRRLPASGYGARL
jgi:hypothetical protein